MKKEKIGGTALALVAFACSAFGQVDFEKQVWPILEEHCIECHKAPYEQDGKLQKPKAGLRLDGAAHILRGSEDGKVVVQNHPGQSTLYQRITLPVGDDDRMPSKEDPLPKEQQEIFRKWIIQGVDFGAWEGATDGIEQFAKEDKDVYAPPHLKFYDDLAKGLKPLSAKALREVRQATGALVRPVGIGSPLLEIRFLGESVSSGDADLGELDSVRQHLAKIDLSRTQVTSESLAFLSRFPRLTRLSLRDTKVGDDHLEKLSSLRHLQYLNLTGTEVSDVGLRKLAKCKSLRDLYLWKSAASNRGVEALSKKLPEVKTRL